MGLTTRRPFGLGEKLVARKAFRCNGKDYAPGDPFRPSESGCDERRIRQMYEAGMIEHEEAQGAAAVGSSERKPSGVGRPRRRRRQRRLAEASPADGG